MGAPQYEQAGADVAGSGTAGTIPVWSTATTLGNSIVKQSGTNIGVNVTPLSSLAGYSSLEVAAQGTGLIAGTNDVWATQNAAYYGGGWKYASSSSSASIQMNANQIIFNRAVAGTAGAALTWLENGRFDASGNFGVGTASPGARLEPSVATTDATTLQEVVRVSRTGGATVGATVNRGALLSFYDTANPTLTGAVGGLRKNAANDYIGHLAFYTAAAQASGVSGLTERVRIEGDTGNVGIGTASPVSGSKLHVAGNAVTASGTTTMTDGFFYIPAAAGAPTGVPTAIAGRVPMYYDTTNNEFYVYNTAWKKVALT